PGCSSPVLSSPSCSRSESGRSVPTTPYARRSPPPGWRSGTSRRPRRRSRRLLRTPRRGNRWCRCGGARATRWRTHGKRWRSPGQDAQALRSGGTGPSPSGALPFPEGAPSLRDAFAKASTELRHALRVALVATLAQFLATALRLERSYWVTVTVVLVLQPHAIATVRRALQRAGGTVIGGLIAALIARHLREPLALGGVLFALAWIAVAERRMNYALFAPLVTPVFVLLAEPNAGAGHLTRVRILDTLLGGTLALAGAIALWPTRDLDRMPALIAAILRADRVYLDAVLHGQGPA